MLPKLPKPYAQYGLANGRCPKPYAQNSFGTRNRENITRNMVYRVAGAPNLTHNMIWSSKTSKSLFPHSFFCILLSMASLVDMHLVLGIKRESFSHSGTATRMSGIGNCRSRQYAEKTEMAVGWTRCPPERWTMEYHRTHVEADEGKSETRSASSTMG